MTLGFPDIDNIFSQVLVNSRRQAIKGYFSSTVLTTQSLDFLLQYKGMGSWSKSEIKTKEINQ